MPDPLILGLLIVAALALGAAAGAIVLVLHLRTRVYALEQLQGLTTRRVKVIAEHVGIPLAVERRHRSRGTPPDGRERRRPIPDGRPAPEGLGGHPRVELPVSSPVLAGDEQRLEPEATSLIPRYEEPVEIVHRPPPPTRTTERIPPMPQLRPSRTDE
jgi:hypothetical protein